MIICRCLCCRVVGVCRVCRWRCRVHTGHWDGHHLTTSTSTSAPFFDHPTAAPRGDPSLLELLNFGINFTMKWIHNIGRKYLVLAAIMAIERLVAKKGQMWQDAALLGKKRSKTCFFATVFYCNSNWIDQCNIDVDIEELYRSYVTGKLEAEPDWSRDLTAPRQSCNSGNSAVHVNPISCYLGLKTNEMWRQYSELLLEYLAESTLPYPWLMAAAWP